MNCSLEPCTAECIADIQWGSDNLEIQTISVCQFHLNKLWETLNPLLKCNKIWFRIDKVGGIMKNPSELDEDKDKDLEFAIESVKNRRSAILTKELEGTREISLESEICICFRNTSTTLKHIIECYNAAGGNIIQANENETEVFLVIDYGGYGPRLLGSFKKELRT